MAGTDDEVAAVIAAVDAAETEPPNGAFGGVVAGLFRLARAAGASESERPAWPGAETTVVVFEPIAGLRAAVRISWAAQSVVASHVREARASGITWPVIGQVLGLQEQAEKEGRPLGQLAYEVARGGTHPATAVPVFYTCGSCLQEITDRGPFNLNPGANERGHAEDCERFGAEVDAYKKRRKRR